MFTASELKNAENDLSVLQKQRLQLSISITLALTRIRKMKKTGIVPDQSSGSARTATHEAPSEVPEFLRRQDAARNDSTPQEYVRWDDLTPEQQAERWEIYGRPNPNASAGGVPDFLKKKKSTSNLPKA